MRDRPTESRASTVLQVFRSTGWIFDAAGHMETWHLLHVRSGQGPPWRHGEIDGITVIDPILASSGGEGFNQKRLISRICDAAFQREAALLDGLDDMPGGAAKPGKARSAWVFAVTRAPRSALSEYLARGATISDFFGWFPDSVMQQVRTVPEHEATILRTSPACRCFYSIRESRRRAKTPSGNCCAQARPRWFRETDSRAGRLLARDTGHPGRSHDMMVRFQHITA